MKKIKYYEAGCFMYYHCDGKDLVKNVPDAYFDTEEQANGYKETHDLDYVKEVEIVVFSKEDDIVLYQKKLEVLEKLTPEEQELLGVSLISENQEAKSSPTLSDDAIGNMLYDISYCAEDYDSNVYGLPLMYIDVSNKMIEIVKKHLGM